MELLFDLTVDRSQLQPGDHIYSFRKLHTYSHHGIYAEADRVIHFNPKNINVAKILKGGRHCGNCGHHPKLTRGVVKTCVDCFLAGHKLYRFEYDVSYVYFLLQRPSTCTTASPVSADKAIRCAVDLLNNKEELDYNLFTYNCESFAMYCKTKKHKMSMQAFYGTISATACVMMFTLLGLMHDVYTHHPDRYMELKETIESLITSSRKEILAALKKLNAKGEDNQKLPEDDKLDKHLKTMEKEYHGTLSQ